MCQKKVFPKFVKKFVEHSTLENLAEEEHKKLSRSDIDIKIVLQFCKNRSTSARYVSKKLRTSVESVQNTKKRNNLLTRNKQKIPKQSSIGKGEILCSFVKLFLLKIAKNTS